MTRPINPAHQDKSDSSDDTKRSEKRTDCSNAAYREVDDTRHSSIDSKNSLPNFNSDCSKLGFPKLDIIDDRSTASAKWTVKGASQQSLSGLSVDSDGKIAFKFKPENESKDVVVLSHRYDQPLREGQGLDLSLKLRADHPGKVTIELVQPIKPYAQTFSEEIDLKGGTQEIRRHGIAPVSPDGILLSVKVDHNVGTMDVQNLSLTPAKALTEEPSHYTIEDGKVVEGKNSDVVIKNDQGKTIEMRNGKPFVVGFEVQSLNPDEHSAAQENIQGLLSNYANGATVTPYWQQWQNNPQDFQKKIHWLQQHGIEIKEHPALWDQVIPSTDAQGRPLTVTLQMIKAHAEEIARLPGKFTEINETADVASAPQNGVTNWIKNETPAKATEQAIDWIRNADPNKTIIYNDYQNGDQEIRMLDQLQKDNKLPDAIGIQLHMDQGNWPLSRVEDTVNKLAKYGKPIYITEISVLSGEYGESVSKVNHEKMEAMSANFAKLAADKNLPESDKTRMDSLHRDADTLAKQTFQGNDVTVFSQMMASAKELQNPALRANVINEINRSKTSWKSTPEGEERQANYTENLYKVLHSNPHVQGITYWDMTDKNSWKLAPRGWFREDGTPKPVVKRMQQLFDKWRTPERDSVPN